MTFTFPFFYQDSLHPMYFLNLSLDGHTYLWGLCTMIHHFGFLYVKERVNHQAYILLYIP